MSRLFKTEIRKENVGFAVYSPEGTRLHQGFKTYNSVLRQFDTIEEFLNELADSYSLDQVVVKYGWKNGTYDNGQKQNYDLRKSHTYQITNSEEMDYPETQGSFSFSQFNQGQSMSLGSMVASKDPSLGMSIGMIERERDSYKSKFEALAEKYESLKEKHDKKERELDKKDWELTTLKESNKKGIGDYFEKIIDNNPSLIEHLIAGSSSSGSQPQNQLAGGDLDELSQSLIQIAQLASEGTKKILIYIANGLSSNRTDQQKEEFSTDIIKLIEKHELI